MRKPANLRKSEIVACVMMLADRMGPDRVTTAAVAAAVGVTQAALFRHFPTKDRLWQAVAEDVVQRLDAAWAEATAGLDAPLDRLQALVATQLREIAARPAMPMLLFSRELNVGNEELRATFRRRLARFHALLAQEFAAAQAEGDLRREGEARDCALMTTALVQGTAIRWALGARDFAIEAEGARLFALYLRLLGASQDSIKEVRL